MALRYISDRIGTGETRSSFSEPAVLALQLHHRRENVYSTFQRLLQVLLKFLESLGSYFKFYRCLFEIMEEKTNELLFKDIDADDEPQTNAVESLCMNCHENVSLKISTKIK